MTLTKLYDGPYMVVDGDNLLFMGVLPDALAAFNVARAQYSKPESAKVRFYECALILSGDEAAEPKKPVDNTTVS